MKLFLLTFVAACLCSAISANSNACSSCSSSDSVCIANANSLQAVTDADCAPCAKGQTFWPCDLEGGCWCWKSDTPKVHPVKASGKTKSTRSACEIFTKDMYEQVAGGESSTYTYDGFCEAVRAYNSLHDEKVFGMGSIEEQKAEIAAFLGNTMHESDMFLAPREYLPCGDSKVVDGKLYCKPCDSGSFDWSTRTCPQSLVANSQPLALGTHGQYCQPSSTPDSNPPGCSCGSKAITEVASSGPLAGYILATDSFFGRGAIQLSWNYNYIKASVALTGSANTFCDDPDLVASNPKYAWGAGIWFWMESPKAFQQKPTETMTSHTAALAGDFGATVYNINGGLECPPSAGGYHEKAVVMRVNRYCKAATVLGVSSLLSFDGCKGLKSSFEGCTAATCADCMPWKGVVNPTTPPTTSLPSNPTAKPTLTPTFASTPPTDGGDVGSACTGEACDEASHCRSKWGYCGKGAEYCNSDTIWSKACEGTRTKMPTLKPTSRVTEDPTKQPTTLRSNPVDDTPSPTTSSRSSASKGGERRLPLLSAILMVAMIV